VDKNKYKYFCLKQTRQESFVFFQNISNLTDFVSFYTISYNFCPKQKNHPFFRDDFLM